jgi:hypothetical protein
VPFSLEDLPLSINYAGQGNPLGIRIEDQSKISPFLWGEMKGYDLRDTFGPTLVRETIANYDVIIQELKPRRILIPEHEEFYRDPLLSESLKSIYDHRCQVCGNNFQIKYNEPFAETHHIKPLSEQGLDISKNIVVTCPNHHRIIHKTKPVFDESKLLYKYPNGLEERLILTEHFEHSSFWSAS